MKLNIYSGSPSTEMEVYRTAFIHSENFVYLIDKEGHFIDCNQNMLQFLGLQSLDDKAGFNLYKAMAGSGHWVKEDKISAMQSEDLKFIQSNSPAIALSEFSLAGSDGSLQNYQLCRKPLMDEKGNLFALEVRLKDITAEKRLQTQMNKIKRELLSTDSHDVFFKTPNNPAEKAAKIPKVLVVEDNKTAQYAAQRILMQANSLVETIASESELLKVFENGKYDLILMDIGLDKTNGFILSKIIRMKEKDTVYHVPIVLLTSYNTDVLAEECKFYRLEGALSKPLSLDKAKELIQHFVYDLNIPVSGLKHAI